MKGCALEAVSALSHKKNKGGFERMKKNLKKVISAVLALTLAMSSFVAMTTSAATFADVADTASYAEAVNALAALGAIAGTGDGTFKPDDNITRAEAATMVVAALNLSADAQNAGATSKFADVNEQAKWAVGYVNVGVAQNYISGTSATTFNPLDNVTYAQMLTMLTRILGYGDFAVSRGGYPDGYVTAASTAGIVKGVVAGTEEPITRAQAAQLIWNAVQAPMLDITTFTGSIDDTQLQQMDGTGSKKFKTILSEKFDAYVLTVTVNQTAKSHGLEAGTVAMTLTNSNEWDPELGDLLKDKGLSSKTYNDINVGKTDAADHLFSSAKVVASYTSYDDEWNLIYFAPNSKITKKVVDGTLINTPTESPAGVVTVDHPATSSDPAWYATTLNIKKSATSSAKYADDYELKDAKLYVNGFEFGDFKNANDTTFNDMIAASTGDMVLIENTNDRFYDIVMIDVYAIAQVTQVRTSEDKTTIRLTAMTKPSGIPNITPPTIEINKSDLEDGKKVVNVTKDGVATTLEGLAIDDVVAVKYNCSQATFGDYIDIIASTKTASGVYTSYDPDTKLYTVGGVQYEDIGGAFTGRNPGDTFTLRLDAFDRVYAADVEVVSKNYAIVERFVKTSEAGGSEYDYIDIVTLDGQQKRLFIDSNFDADTVFRTGTNDITHNYTTNAGVSMANRFISYKVRPSTGRVTSVVRETAQLIKTGSSEVFYNASTNRLGSALTSTAVVLDAVAYTKEATKLSGAKLNPTLYKASSLSNLVENVAYEGYLIHKTEGSNQYAYVVITSAGALYSTNSDFAVVAANAAASSKVYADDEELYALKIAGADEALKVATNAEIYVDGAKVTDADNTNTDYESGLSKLTKGSVFFYTVDQYGYVDRIDVVFTNGASQTAMQTALKTNAVAANAADTRVDIDASAMTSTKVITADWYNKLDDSALVATNELVQMFIAPVLSASASSVSFAELKTATAGDGNDGNGVALNGKQYVDTSKDYSFSIAADANIYSVDASNLSDKAAVTLGAFQGIRANLADANERAWLSTTVAKDASSFEYDYTADVQYALVMAVDGVVTNAVVFDNVQ